MSDHVAVTRALLSVYDKDGLVEFATALAAEGVELVSSGGTAAALSDHGLEVTEVSTVTGSPEMLGGRVKTLHPAIHGGILADLAKPSHRDELAAAGIEPIQLVVSNLYPFSQTVERPGVTEAEAIEQIDIGGPAMIRAAAKNHRWVGVVTSPAQYAEVAEAVAAGGLPAELRRRLARAAFFHTAGYDAAVVGWLERGDRLPERIVLPLERTRSLRYGENPHQEAATYRQVGAGPGWWDAARIHQGKELSFNNMLDAEAAWRLAAEFTQPAVVVVKHTNPCGVAAAADLPAAFTAAWEGDPLSAFGSVIAMNRPLDAVTAGQVAERFVEVVIAPDVADDALAVLSDRTALRVLSAPPPTGADLDLRRIEHGMLVQRRDRVEAREGWSVATQREPTPVEWGQLDFAWRVAAHVKSNAIVVARDSAAVGVGAGDQSRVGAAERALRQADDRAVGAVAASDAFFPFRDGLDLLAAAGVTAVVQPGGSRRDAEVIAAADEHGVAMVMTGMRHFRH